MPLTFWDWASCWNEAVLDAVVRIRIALRCRSPSRIVYALTAG